LREVNRAGVAVHDPTPPPLRHLGVREMEAAIADGAHVVDVRPVDAFGNGHVPESVSIPWRAQFATWLGWLIPRDQPVVIIADDTIDRADLVWAAYTIGYERLVGELAGGVDAWRDAGRELARTPVVGPDEVADRRVVDIRQRSEYSSGHVPGAVHVELGELTETVGPVPEGPVLLHCGHGERAMSAASLLERAGRRDVAVLAGSPEDLGTLEVDA